ncbi:AAA family ATPase [Streptomyces mirabilis]|uniref:AAA family ATPase n=1 Tax=Streptomyces mirabilis TaxID=68239 RepID=UPI003F4CF117
MAGTEETRLVVLRGNSASGKSSVAGSLRDRLGRGLALVGQDNLRLIVLSERDRPGAANIGLINLTARYALDAGYHVVVEGTLYADRYGDMLTQLRADHRGPIHAYYLHVPFEQTLARHATKPIANAVGEPQLRDWHRPIDCRRPCRPGADRAAAPGRSPRPGRAAGSATWTVSPSDGGAADRRGG